MILTSLGANCYLICIFHSLRLINGAFFVKNLIQSLRYFEIGPDMHYDKGSPEVIEEFLIREAQDRTGCTMGENEVTLVKYGVSAHMTKECANVTDENVLFQKRIIQTLLLLKKVSKVSTVLYRLRDKPMVFIFHTGRISFWYRTEVGRGRWWRSASG